ncbi:hypothetical protein QE429_000312 [Bacillus sp. SORGH_AS 510]|nr:hypothetical protein [Bacillus sp. SORGH_AS_0510]
MRPMLMEKKKKGSVDAGYATDVNEKKEKRARRRGLLDRC